MPMCGPLCELYSAWKLVGARPVVSWPQSTVAWQLPGMKHVLLVCRLQTQGNNKQSGKKKRGQD